MHKPRNKIKLDSYVELKENFADTDLYRNVDAGATGWVKDSKIDESFPMIFIEWDENHPKYAGEKDKWVYESHFKVLDDTNSKMVKYIDTIRKATDAALAGEAFITISISRIIHPITGNPIYKPTIAGESINDEAALVLEAQIAYMASQLFNEYIEDTLFSLRKDREDESGR
jgi:hypothetical protein